MRGAARDSASCEAVLAVGRQVLTEDDVLDGVPGVVGTLKVTLKVECLFGDGTWILHVERPIRPAVPGPDGPPRS